MPIIISLFSALIVIVATMLVTRLEVDITKTTARGIASINQNIDKFNRLISLNQKEEQLKPHPVFRIFTEKLNESNDDIHVSVHVIGQQNAKNVSWRVVGDTSYVLDTLKGELGTLNQDEEKIINLRFSKNAEKPVFIEVYVQNPGGKIGMTLDLPVYLKNQKPALLSQSKTLGLPGKRKFQF